MAIFLLVSLFYITLFFYHTQKKKSIATKLFSGKSRKPLCCFLNKNEFSLPFLNFIQKTNRKNTFFGKAHKNEFFVKSRLTPLPYIYIICSVRSMGIAP
jgi:hypothetical protein